MFMRIQPATREKQATEADNTITPLVFLLTLITLKSIKSISTGMADKARIPRSVTPLFEYELPKRSNTLSLKANNTAIAGTRISRYNFTDFVVLG